MTLRRWWIWTAASWLLASALWFGTQAASRAVVTRDEGWDPGPLSWIVDLISDGGPLLALVILLIAEFPAALWRRRGASFPETLGVGQALAFAVFGPSLLPQGYPEDSYIPFLVIGLALCVTLACAFICIFVRPKDESA